MRTSIRLPKSVSEYLIDDLDESLNTIFPKMFFSIEIKRGCARFDIPVNMNIKSIIDINEYYIISNGKPIRRFQIIFPRLGIYYVIYYDNEKHLVTFAESMNYESEGVRSLNFE